MTHPPHQPAPPIASNREERDAIMTRVKGYAQLAGVILFIMLAFGISFSLKVTQTPLREDATPERQLMVEALPVIPGTHPIRFTATGLIKAKAPIDITPEVSGRIIGINDNVFAGGRFEAGELLFQIDPTDYQLEVRRLEAMVAEAQTAYDIEQTESEMAKAEWVQIHGKKRKAPDLVLRKPQMEEAQAALEAAKAQLQKAHIDLERTVFSLPFKGRMTHANLSEGQYVSTGQAYGQAYDVQSLEVETSLNDTKLGWLMSAGKNGQTPHITITAQHQGQKLTFQGILKRGAAELNSQTRFATIAIGLDPSDFKARLASEKLLPGIMARLSIEGPLLHTVTPIPLAALSTDPTSTDRTRKHVWLVNPHSSTLYRQTVTSVFNDGETALVKGLAAGSLLVTHKIFGASEGIKVKHTHPASPDTPTPPAPLNHEDFAARIYDRKSL